MLSNLIRLFYPESCAACHGFLLQDEFVICTHCRHQLPTTLHHTEPTHEIHQKFYGRIPLVFAGALLYFHKESLVQELIHQLKYKGNENVGTALGLWHGAILKVCIISPYPDFIVPVPLHPKKLNERGYNQVTTYAKALAESLEIPCNEELLHRNYYSKTQTKKSILGRAEIIQSIFGITFNQQHHNKHFMLVDDVITTGSTLEACSRELLKIPGAKISIVCMAMSQ
ncbi:MAG: hypothetical protein RL607_1581 [Bacteroidota bacterium]|jgi:ComF family protein